MCSFAITILRLHIYLSWQDVNSFWSAYKLHMNYMNYIQQQKSTCHNDMIYIPIPSMRRTVYLHGWVDVPWMAMLRPREEALSPWSNFPLRLGGQQQTTNPFVGTKLQGETAETRVLFFLLKICIFAKRNVWVIYDVWYMICDIWSS